MEKSVQRRAHPERPVGSSIEGRPLTARDVANRCGVELKTVHNWVERGLLHHFRTPGRHLRFRSAHVDEFLSRQASFTTGSVLVIGVRLRGAPSAWTMIQDAFEGLCRAGAEQPNVVVVVARGLAGIDGARYVRALRRSVSDARLLWVGKSPPHRGGKKLEQASDLEDVKRRLSRA